MQEESDAEGAMPKVSMHQTHPEGVQNSYPQTGHDSNKTVNHPREWICPKRLSPAAGERGWLCLSCTRKAPVLPRHVGPSSSSGVKPVTCCNPLIPKG